MFRRMRRRTGWMGKLVLLLASVLFALVLAEGLLRLGWTNPYAGEEADRIQQLWIPHVRMDRLVDRSLISPDSPDARLRTDDRGYTMPSFRHADPDLTSLSWAGRPRPIPS
jgi:hypothetical protein